MDYENTSDSNKEILEDKKTKESLAALESIFSSANSDGNFFDDSKGSNDDLFNGGSMGADESLFNDPLEKTNSINEVDLDQLREYSKKLHSIMDEEETKAVASNDSDMTNSGKQKVLTAKPKPKMYDDSSSDMSQILSSFISCSILSFVTAAMGVGFLLNIIIRIK